jgi:hypothetical protein
MVKEELKLKTMEPRNLKRKAPSEPTSAAMVAQRRRRPDLERG